MPRRTGWLGVAVAVFLAVGSARGDDAAALAGQIDRHITARLAADKVPQAPLADDAEFLRRVYLDLNGVIPTARDVRDFLADKSPDKRQRLVEQLLGTMEYATHFSRFWRTLLLPDFGDNSNAIGFAAGLENWLRPRVAADIGYDQLVRELLTHRITAGRVARVLDREIKEPGPSPEGYYLSREIRPENLAAGTSRLFLGVRLECAQCHHHPFAKWKREQFWGYAAFFAGMQAPAGASLGEENGRRELKIPGTGQVVTATFLDGRPTRWQSGVGTRAALAEWMTAPDNPYFARAAANRLWAYFFGTGIVDPVDDLEGPNQPSHPELLNELARQLAAHQFDMKYLMRAIVLSRAYQSTSRSTHPGQDEPQRFARMAVKGLTAEQMYDSLIRATNYREPLRPGPEPGEPAMSSARTDLLTRFFTTSRDKSTETQTSILQAFALMNGPLMDDLTRLKGTGTLASVAGNKSLTTPQRIETLFLSTLSRLPTAAERDKFTKYVESGGPDRDGNKALADVFWALLNSGEFVLNH